MKAFMDGDFLLTTESAKKLYHGFAAPAPVIDYHCHVNPAEIAQNRRYENVAQLFLGGDHYKWRLLRAGGEPEEFVTGGGTDYEKFAAFARVLPKAAGNPVYHWTHLELQRYFDCDIPLSPATADEIWRRCNARLDNLTVRDILRRSRVEALATTDDPADSLEWHKAVAADPSLETKVYPTFRPDKAIHIEKPEFAPYLAALGTAAGIRVKTLDDLFAALETRIGFFGAAGCRASDHGLDSVPYAEDAEGQAPAVLERALNGEALSAAEIEKFQTALLLFLGRAYAKRGWVMQLHYGVQRGINAAMTASIGADTGFDAIGTAGNGRKIAALLNALNQTGQLPKTILYCLNPGDDAMLDTVCGCFAEVQHGSAWWFNDSKQGMERHLTGLASRGLLGGFVGMLTDSRSFLSYTRHEYFRRILCSLLGRWVEDGELPHDMEALGALVLDVSYGNTKRFFGF
ncbi:MAG: glucuronate isomerase [Oscillospiraceae bacterium]|jgi:glucuronate isomerase|nr:glucuronate isomerase [Oscillospiraceae bacterium]